MLQSNHSQIGFIGFGEAAFEISKGLKSEGVKGIVAYDKYADVPPKGSLIRKRALEADVVLLPSLEEVIARSEVIFCAVSAAAAISIAEEAARFLKAGKIYVDINSASPRTKQKVAEVIESTGADFVDIAVMGSVPERKHKVPMLASGCGAEKLVVMMKAYGMNIKDVGKEPGMASAIKMARSVFMKGYAALWVECLLAASAYSCIDLVVDSIRESIEGKDLRIYLVSFLGRTGIHAERRVSEMKEVLSMLEEIGSPSAISQATLLHLEQIAKLGLSDIWSKQFPSDIEEIVSVFRKGYKV